MPVRKANAEWKGTLKDGTGTLKSQTGAIDGRYSFTSRFEEGTGTNPEELIAAAHSGCFSMALSGSLGKAGFNPVTVKTEDKVYLEKVGEGFKITKIEVSTEAEVPGIDNDTFQKLVEETKKNCPVSQALRATEIIVVSSNLK
ncbi:MAG: OsmC family protein [Bacillota bacterium]